MKYPGLGRNVNVEQLSPYIASNYISNLNGDFTASPVIGTTKIMISGLTPHNSNVILGRFFRYDGIQVTSLDYNSFSIDGSMIDLPNIDRPFKSGDEVYCILNEGRLRGFDNSLDIYKMLNQNPDKRDICSVEPVFKETNLAVGTHFKEVYPDHYELEFHTSITDGTGATVKVYYSLDEDDTVPDTDGSVGGNWKEITSSVFGSAVTGTDINEIGGISSKRGRFLIEVDIANATNVVKFLIKKI
ncbi:MAG TPA: hypothetical protein VKN64_04445 [Halanaerobiales bacterium]|nr:hypothetical protein [Halanaerobiales bacterium]